jgi:hypothetical protein
MAHDHYTPAQLAMFARRQKMNNESMLAFLAAILALTSVLVVFHFVRRTGKYLGTSRPSFSVAITRKARSLLNRKVPGLPSAGHAVVVFIYVVINAVIMGTNIDLNNMPLNPNMASRTGW